MKNNNQNLSAKGVSLTPSQWERCDRLTERYGKKSRNLFIREAVDFYCAWLEKEHIQKFLLPSLESVMSAKIRDSEERLRRLLFKIAVDQDMLAVLFSREYDHYDDYTLEEIRKECVRTVSETNGTLRVSEHMK